MTSQSELLEAASDHLERVLAESKDEDARFEVRQALQLIQGAQDTTSGPEEESSQEDRTAAWTR